MNERIFIEIAQIRPSGLLIYSIAEPPFAHKRSEAMRETKAYSGRMTEGAKKRVRRAVNVFLLKSPAQTMLNPVSQKVISFRLTFATVTISSRDIINTREAYKEGLAKLLRFLRERVGGLYLWKAELQARGQVHYHITLNRFMHYKELRDEWNRIQRSAGWLEGFEGRTGHSDANSTDIHAVGKIDRIDLYLSKYLSKDGGRIEGKVWGCSKELMNAKYFEFYVEDEQEFLIDTIEKKHGVLTRHEHFTTISSTNKSLLVPPGRKEKFDKWVKE